MEVSISTIILVLLAEFIFMLLFANVIIGWIGKAIPSVGTSLKDAQRTVENKVGE